MRLNSFSVVTLFFLLLLFALEILALQKNSHYVYDIPMCMLLQYFLYHFRSFLHLNIFHYIMLSLFLILHCMGLYNAYSHYPLGIEYDYWVHGYFGFVSGLIILRWMSNYMSQLNDHILLMFTLFFILGISSLHELYEFIGALLLGRGEGVLFIGAGDLDQWDTQKDMLNNLLGAIIAILIVHLRKNYFFTK